MLFTQFLFIDSKLSDEYVNLRTQEIYNNVSVQAVSLQDTRIKHFSQAKINKL